METNKEIKVEFYIPLEYIYGYLRCGHKEGILYLTEEELKKLKEDPIKSVEEEEILHDLELVVDDYRIEDCGFPLEVKYEVIT